MHSIFPTEIKYDEPNWLEGAYDYLWQVTLPQFSL